MVAKFNRNAKLTLVLLFFIYWYGTNAVKWEKTSEKILFVDNLSVNSENTTDRKWQDSIETHKSRQTHKKKHRQAGTDSIKDDAVTLLVPKRLSDTERLVKLHSDEIEDWDSERTTTKRLIRSKFFKSEPDDSRVKEKHRDKTTTNEKDAISISKMAELFAKAQTKRNPVSTNPFSTKDEEKKLQLHINLDPKKTEKIYNEILREGESNNADENTRIKVRAKKKHKGKSITELRSTRMPEIYELQEEERKKDPRGSASVEEIESLSPYAIFRQMQLFAEGISKTHGANVTATVLDRTAEYNNIVLIKMSANPPVYRSRNIKYEENREKKIIFIVHGLTVMGMRYLTEDNILFNILMNFYMKHLDKFDVFVIPMANPDGYAATLNHKAYQFWNKNMSPQNGCPGVVLDRNFDVAWNNSVNISSCSPLYPGPRPFSEVETRVIRELLRIYGQRIEAYIHVHASSFDHEVFKGDAILYPRGYSDDHIDDDVFLDLRGEVEEVMKNASFRTLSVTVDTLYNWYGPVSGSSVDYAYSVYGIPFAMEFAMQIYEDLQDLALQQIWGRIIPLVFQSIWKSVNSTNNEVSRKMIV